VLEERKSRVSFADTTSILADAISPVLAVDDDNKFFSDDFLASSGGKNPGAFGRDSSSAGVLEALAQLDEEIFRSTTFETTEVLHDVLNDIVDHHVSSSPVEHSREAAAEMLRDRLFAVLDSAVSPAESESAVVAGPPPEQAPPVEDREAYREWVRARVAWRRQQAKLLPPDPPRTNGRRRPPVAAPPVVPAASTPNRESEAPAFEAPPRPPVRTRLDTSGGMSSARRVIQQQSNDSGL
jgi:hypothetical protein